MQEKSPMLRLWELGEQYHGGLIHAGFPRPSAFYAA